MFHRPVEYGDGNVYFLEVDLKENATVHGWSALDGQQGQDLPGFLAHLLDWWCGCTGTLS